MYELLKLKSLFLTFLIKVTVFYRKMSVVFTPLTQMARAKNQNKGKIKKEMHCSV